MVSKKYSIHQTGFEKRSSDLTGFQNLSGLRLTSQQHSPYAVPESSKRLFFLKGPPGRNIQQAAYRIIAHAVTKAAWQKKEDDNLYSSAHARHTEFRKWGRFKVYSKYDGTFKRKDDGDTHLYNSKRF